MYKAGDFTNGKMNEIFKKATVRNQQDQRSVKKAFISGPIINHKQLGDFVLIDKELFAIKSAILHEAITGVKIEEFYTKHGDGDDDSNERQLKAVNDILLPCGYDEVIDWNDAYFALADRLSLIVCNSDAEVCSEYMKRIAGGCDDK